MEGVNDWMRFKRAITTAAILVALCGCTCALAGCTGQAEAQAGDVRFDVTLQTDSAFYTDTAVIVDTETGCQYLWVYRPTGNGGAGGLTLLVDGDGRPMLDRRRAKEGE